MEAELRRTEQLRGQRRRDEIMEVIEGHWRERGFGPSVREIGDAVHLGPSAVLFHLTRLEFAGRLRSEPGRARTWRPA